MRWIFSLIIYILVSSPYLRANTCPEPSKLDDILSCLKNNHYLVRIRDYDVEQSQHLEKAMGQWKNPVLDVQTVHAKGGDRQTQIILAQELDLAGRISVLRNQGRLIHSVSLLEKSIAQEEVIEAVLMTIHHLLHLKETLLVNHEVHSSLEAIISSLKKRPALSPDQQASLLNFDLQRAEISNMIALLEDEEEEAMLFFLLNGGYKKEQVHKVMEDHHHPLELVSTADSLSLNLEKLGLETKLAQEEYSLQKANLWDGITVGPMFMDDQMDSISEKLLGVAFTMPIPVWNLNGANRTRAQIQMTSRQRQFDLFQRKEVFERDSLISRIDKLKVNLKNLPRSSELARAHKKVESLYSRGLISSTVYLDSHRIWRDVSRSKLELEEKILSLTIKYYRLAGKLAEVHL